MVIVIYNFALRLIFKKKPNSAKILFLIIKITFFSLMFGCIPVLFLVNLKKNEHILKINIRYFP